MKNFGKLKVEAMNAEGLGNKFATLVDFFKYVVGIGFEQLEIDFFGNVHFRGPKASADIVNLYHIGSHWSEPSLFHLNLSCSIFP